MPVYELTIGFDYVDNDDLTNMKDLTALGMNYQETITTSAGEVPNPQSKLDFIKQEIANFIYRNMARGDSLSNEKDVIAAHKQSFRDTYRSKVIEV